MINVSQVGGQAGTELKLTVFHAVAVAPTSPTIGATGLPRRHSARYAKLIAFSTRLHTLCAAVNPSPRVCTSGP